MKDGKKVLIGVCLCVWEIALVIRMESYGKLHRNLFFAGVGRKPRFWTWKKKFL